MLHWELFSGLWRRVISQICTTKLIILPWQWQGQVALKRRYILTTLHDVTSTKRVTCRQSRNLTSAIFSTVLFGARRNIMVRIIWGVACRSAARRAIWHAAIWRRVGTVRRTRPAFVQSIVSSFVRFFEHLFSRYLLRGVSDEEGEGAIKIQAITATP